MESFISFFSEITCSTPSLSATIGALIAVGLLLVSGFISASEVAFFSLSPQQRQEIEELRHDRDKTVVHLIKRTDSLLASILIANNFVNVSIIILLETFFNEILSFGDNMIALFFFQTVFLTFLLLLIGEIMPKIYASQNPLHFARFSAPVLSMIERILRPFSFLMIRSTSIVNKRITKKNVNISMDELSHALELTSDEIKEEKEILQEVIKFGTKTVDEVMTPRLDIASIEIGCNFSKVLETVVGCGYSRIPVYEGTQDHIKGILYAKDLLPYLEKEDLFDWRTLLRSAYYVPESKKIDDLLTEFQSLKIHLAIVVDEFGGTAGLITLEDILEELVGDISDEYDEDEQLYFKTDDNTYIFEGKTPLNDFFKITKSDERDFEELIEEVDTLAGLILEIKGNFPERREWIEYKFYRFQVLEMSKHRINKIKFMIPSDNEQ